MAGTPEHFDCIVVGTGFGGSVTAQRLAEADRRVLVLERGKAYPPGSFPRSPIGFKNNLWDPSEGLQGLFDLWSFSGLDALISSGLGGGSLIYANVLLRKDEKWFVSPDHPGPGGEAWPITRADLDPHYDRAEKMLGAAALSARACSLQQHAQDARVQGGGRGAEHGLVPPAAGRHIRKPGRGSGPGRADQGGAAEHPRPHARRPAASSASATSAATTAPRTRSTTTT